MLSYSQGNLKISFQIEGWHLIKKNLRGENINKTCKLIMSYNFAFDGRNEFEFDWWKGFLWIRRVSWWLWNLCCYTNLKCWHMSKVLPCRQGFSQAILWKIMKKILLTELSNDTTGDWLTGKQKTLKSKVPLSLQTKKSKLAILITARPTTIDLENCIQAIECLFQGRPVLPPASVKLPAFRTCNVHQREATARGAPTRM